jgi:hypothetical protein
LAHWKKSPKGAFFTMRRLNLHLCSILFTGGVAACAAGTGDGGDFASNGVDETGDDVGDSGDGDSESDDGEDGPGIKLDVDPPDGDDDPVCKVNDDMDAVGDCDETAPAESFEPSVQWEWTGDGDKQHAVAVPLVGNLTDDNGDDAIDLCDTPDIVVQACTIDMLEDSGLYVLDGETGELQYETFYKVACATTPAIGDIDNDGIMEIVAVDTVLHEDEKVGQIVAFENDGTLKWKGGFWPNHYIGAIALADLDNDGTTEIIGGNVVFDNEGNELFTAQSEFYAHSATTAADLDGDGDLEVVLGSSAFHHDGTPLFINEDVQPGYPQIADLDDDPQPEILLTTADGFGVLEHDGTTKYMGLAPTGDPPGAPLGWRRPAVIHDTDGDGEPEFAQSSYNWYALYEADGSMIWKVPVDDQSGVAAGTAFDFLGDAGAEAIYADEQDLFVFDDVGQVLLQTKRRSATGIEYPVVADVDNDKSAEIVIVSNADSDDTWPTIKVVRDVEDRWIQARRIWNQHTYHVTNVREDGTIPQFEKPSWEHLNTFRSNAQIEDGGVCKPVG